MGPTRGMFIDVKKTTKISFMKKHVLVLSFVLLAFGTASFAQIQKGYYLIGGSLGSTSIGFSDGTPFNINITPKVAWFRNDKFAVGGFVDIGLATASGQGTRFNYGFGPLARYYFGSSAV